MMARLPFFLLVERHPCRRSDLVPATGCCDARFVGLT
jgi:hypothetical protein